MNFVSSSNCSIVSGQVTGSHVLVVLASILSCCHIRQENGAVNAVEVTGIGLRCQFITIQLAGCKTELNQFFYKGSSPAPDSIAC